jgi:GTP-binding protein Era
MFKRILKWFFRLFKKKNIISLGIYGPPNTGKTTLANKISLDFTGEELGTVSEIPHETRTVQKKERIELKVDGRTMLLNLLDMPGISTKVDYRDFRKYGLGDLEAKERAKEATKGIIEAIKWLDNVDACLVVLDATKDPYTQINITIIGNLEARGIPIVLVANKIDMDGANAERIKDAFPQHPMVAISAKEGTNIEELYNIIFEKLSR